MKKKAQKRIAAAVLAVFLLFGVFGLYVADHYSANEVAAAALLSTEQVTVIAEKDYTAFIPNEPKAGFIFYPGGKVESTAYAPLMQALSKEGILCVLLNMPFNLAVFAPNAAEDIPQSFPQIQNWVLGGHSLGGSMAASCLSKNPEAFSGIALLASYSTAELPSVPVLSLYGSEDTVLNGENYEKYKQNLPQDLTEIVIDGGCHAGFGAYGAQKGDGTPKISSADQTALAASLLTEFILT